MAAPDLSDERTAPATPGERRALIGSTILVVGALIAQAPGRIVPETKLDVLVDPVRYLGRALSAWDPAGGFGRVQNQAIGYLFPMGAWTSLGRLVHVPPWLTQRLWIAGVVLAGMWGAHRLARAVGIASPSGRLVAAWAYALAPATVATVAFQSAGQLPYSLAPWVLVPLVEMRNGDNPRRVAARSALFVLAMGGVNGASAFAVLPLVAIWFTTRQRGRERTRLFLWWAGSAVLATLWWIVPLLVSVRYGVRFTSFTEQASLTTTTESATEILRGTGNWLSYLPVHGGHWLPGAYQLATQRVAIVGSIAVAAAGIAGLARRDAPGRSWLVPSAVLGTVAMGIAYGGDGGGSFAPFAQHLLDGPLAPFRNVHKFAAVVHLPLALGLGHLVAVHQRPSPARPTDADAEADADADVGADADTRAHAAPSVLVRGARRSAATFAVLAIVVAIAPALPGRLTAPGSFDGVPSAWRDAARWIDRHEGGQRTLILPGSSFGEYDWGRPLDEPLASLLEGNWAIRDLVPLGGTGSTRLLDGIDTALLGDHLPDGFVPTLQRAGVRYLLVRNDLDLPRTEGPSPTSVRRVLATASPHLDRVASFGPSDDARRNDGRATPEPGAPSLGRYRTIDVYAVPHAVDRVTSYPAASSLVVGGGPEAVLQLPASATDGRATVLAVDEPRTGLPDSIRVATDTARRRDVIFGAIRNNATYTLTPGERSPVTAEPPEDRWPGDGPVGLSVAHVDGAATLQADEPRTDLLDPEGQPASAFDGSPTTSWLPATPAEGRWIEVGLDRARTVSDVTVAIPSTTGARVGSVVVTTDAGSRTVTIGADGSVRVPVDHSTTRVRVTIASVIGGVEVRPLGLSEIRIGGLHIGRSVVAAPPGRGGAAAPATAAWFSRLRRDRFDRFRSDEEGRLARTVALTGGEGLELTGTATSTPGPALDRLLATAVPSDGSRVIAGSGAPSIRATASSRWRDQPVFDATAAVDGDPATAWVSDSEVSAPVLRLSWPGAVPVDRIRIRTAPVPGTDPVPTVSVLVDGRRYLRDIPAGGWIRIPKTRVDQLVLAFPRPDPTDTGARLVGILEVDLAGLHRAPAARPDRDAAIDLPCGSGPVIRFDGRSIATRGQATAGALLDGAPVPWQACEALDVRTGTHRIEGPAGGPLAVATASLTPGGGRPVPAAARSVSIRSWGREHRTLAVGAGSATILATTENVNRGWRATRGGRTLTPIRVDGWRQGWLLPAGTRGTIHLDYAPGTGQRAGLVVGAIAVIGLLALAFVGRTRRGGAAARSAWSVPGEQPWPVPALLGSAVLAGVALGGPAVLLLLPVLALPRRDRSLPLVAMGATVAGGIVAFVSPHAAIINHEGTLSLPAQLFAVVAVLALAASSVPESISPSAGAGSTRSNHGPTGRRRRRSDTTPEGTD